MRMTDPAMFPSLAMLCSAHAFDVPLTPRQKETREQPGVFSRQVAVWLLHDVCGWGSQMIGRMYRRDHGTVLHAVRAVENRIQTEPDVAERVTKARGLFLRVTGKVAA